MPIRNIVETEYFRNARRERGVEFTNRLSVVERNPKRRAVITGAAGITSLGSLDETYQALLNGVSGIKRLNRDENGRKLEPDDPRYDPRYKDYIIDEVQVGAPLPLNFDPDKLLLLKSLDRRFGLSTLAETSIVLTRQALAMAGLLDQEKRFVLTKAHPQVKDLPKYERKGYPASNRTAGWISSGISATGKMTDIQKYILENKLSDRRIADLALQMFPEALLGRTAIGVGFSGWGGNTAEACATGASNIVEGARLIQDGLADVVVAGGLENVFDTHPNITALSFLRLLTASTNPDPKTACRPFDSDRDGLVCGSGGAIVVLESLENAQNRGATILAELSRFFKSMDGYTELEPTLLNSVNVADTITHPLRVSSDRREFMITPDGINAHATSTVKGDIGEAAALRLALGSRLFKSPVWAPKSGLAHLFGGAGSMSIALAIKELQNGLMPHNQNLANVDPAVTDLDLVRDKPRAVQLNNILAPAYGFEGFNVVALVERFVEEMIYKAA